MRICAVFGVLLLATSTCFAHSNANGFGYFALEWPSDVTYVADGEDGDWAWYDPNFIVTPDEMGEVVQQVIPDKERYRCFHQDRLDAGTRQPHLWLCAGDGRFFARGRNGSGKRVV